MLVTKHSWVIRRPFSHSSTRTLEHQNTGALEYLPDRRACRGPYFLRVGDGFEFIRFYDFLGNILCDSRSSLVRDLQVHISLLSGTDDVGHQGHAGSIPAAQCPLSLCPLSPQKPVMLRLVRLPFSYRCKSCSSLCWRKTQRENQNIQRPPRNDDQLGNPDLARERS
jgi:hypothetical protein